MPRHSRDRDTAKTAPALVAPIEQVEKHGAAHKGHPGLTNGKAAAPFMQIGLDASAGIEAERGAAGQEHGINALDRAMRLKKVGFAGAGRSATDVDEATAGSRKRWPSLPKQDAPRSAHARPGPRERR